MCNSQLYGMMQQMMQPQQQGAEAIPTKPMPPAAPRQQPTAGQVPTLPFNGGAR